MTLQEILINMDACNDAVEFAEGKSLEQAWNECPRGDWMLWIYVRSKNVDQKKLFLAKGYCAKTVEHLMKDERSRKAVQAAIDFGNGTISDDERQIAGAAAYAADASAAYAAAAYAADAASAASAAYAAYASAAYAAYAAAAYAADAYAYAADARTSNQLTTADICRQYLPMPELAQIIIEEPLKTAP